MSNYVLNNKFKKWSSLLAQNPDNLDYKNKVSKYGTLMVRAVQGGGNGNGEVDELLRKIDGVVRKNNMNGGGKQVTGYRNMRGGDGDFEEAQTKIRELGTEIDRQNQAYAVLVTKFSTSVNALIARLNAEKQQLEKKNIEIGEAAAIINQLKQDLTAKGDNENQELAQLRGQLETKQKNLNAQIAELTKQIADLKVEAMTAADNIKENREITELERQTDRNIAALEKDAAAVPSFGGGSRRTTRRH
jgi:chromosome segregation ATPase